MASSNVLILDDEVGILNALIRSLRGAELMIAVATSAEQGLEVLEQGDFKVVISDQRMKGMQGTEFLALVKKLHPQVVTIMLTGHATLETAIRAVNEGGIYRLLTKPWSDSELRESVLSALAKYDAGLHAAQGQRTVARRHREQVQLEQLYPGITAIEKDSSGRVILGALSDLEGNVIKSRLDDE